MRKQYYFRPSERGLMAWDVDRLITLTKHFPRIHVALTSIRELDEPFWSDDDTPMWRAFIEHVGLVEAADLSFAIILSSDGRVMDGMHRVAKAMLLGRATIEAVQFTDDPEPDYVGVQPNDLPYDETPKTSTGAPSKAVPTSVGPAWLSSPRWATAPYCNANLDSSPTLP